ncbi:hypothetical protein RN001_004449 [Aquatica leii]|uniref:Uncharacterized protein n=1 Tax=Aquatica leii TaxID=1421715 RepID=A0AAN7SRQ0_9COLE|nr:hypothetical protein RN001_004449 [Aquatica leii]
MTVETGEYLPIKSKDDHPLVIILMVIYLALHIAMLVVGIDGRDNCPLEQRIPLYLIVAGAVGLLSVLIPFINRKFNFPYVDILTTLLYLFEFGWMILGSIWIYGIYPPNFDPSTGNYCNKTVYLVSFWLLSTQWIFLVVTIILSFCCYFCYDSKKSYIFLKMSKHLSQKELEYYVNHLSDLDSDNVDESDEDAFDDDDDNFCPDNPDLSESDHEEVASEISDIQSASDMDDLPQQDSDVMLAKDGTQWFCNAPPESRTRAHNIITDNDIIQYAINLENGLRNYSLNKNRTSSGPISSEDVVEVALINNERSDIPLVKENSKVAKVTIVNKNVFGFKKDVSCIESTNHKLTGNINEEILSDLEWRAQDDGSSETTRSDSDLIKDEIDVAVSNSEHVGEGNLKGNHPGAQEIQRRTRKKKKARG